MYGVLSECMEFVQRPAGAASSSWTLEAGTDSLHATLSRDFLPSVLYLQHTEVPGSRASE